MPSVPLVSELGSHAQEFVSLVTKAKIPENLRLEAEESREELFSMADTRIFVRERPILPGETDLAPIVRKVAGYKNAIFLSPKISVSCACTIEATPVTIDRMFDTNDTTATVYATTCASLVKLAMEGGSASVLCYGQTGSGKTYTTSGMLRLMAKDIESYLAGSVITVVFIELQGEQTCIDLITGDAVQIAEDTSSRIQLMGAKETQISCAQQFLDLVEIAAAARSTKSTQRNEVSSRSHMIARIVIRPQDTPWAQPGVLCVLDLAGSENTADSATHDKERLAETRFINTSLMTLKECIRARGLASTSTKHIHIPYRQSKLTLLMRDTFELVVKRPTKTAVIACVSPLLQDVRHTGNTLRYASLLYIAPKSNVVVETDPNDPNNWDREHALAFIVTASRNRVRCPEIILPEGDGRALAQVPEAEFIRRCLEEGELAEKSAKALYVEVWKKVIDARTKLRKCTNNARTRLSLAPEKENRTGGAAAAAQKPHPLHRVNAGH